MDVNVIIMLSVVPEGLKFRAAQILEVRSLWRLNFVRLPLIFVDSQYRNCFVTLLKRVK